LQDIVVDVGQLRRPFHFLACGAGAGQGDIVGDGGGEQERFLRHPAYGRAQRMQGVGVQRLAVPRGRARLRRHLAQQHAQQGRLAAASGTHQAQGLARQQVQRDAGQRRRRLARVGKTDLLQLQGAGRQRINSAVVVDGQRRVEHGLQALPGGATPFDQ